MLLSTSRPEMTFTLDGTGAAFLTDEAALINGRPGSGTRIQWLSGAQTTASVLKLRGAWAAIGNDDVVNFAGLVGTTLPIGLRVVASVQFGMNWDSTPIEGVVTQREDGVRVVWFVFPSSVPPSTGIQFAIYNDEGGVATIVADSAFDIGELWAGPSAEWCIRPTYESGRDDLSIMRKSIGGQPFPVRRRSQATSQVEFTPVIYSKAFGGPGLSAIRDLSSVREALLAYEPAVIVPMTSEPFTGGGVDSDYVNKFAEFGYANSIGPINGEAPRFVMSAGFIAPPPLLPA